MVKRQALNSLPRASKTPPPPPPAADDLSAKRIHQVSVRMTADERFAIKDIANKRRQTVQDMLLPVLLKMIEKHEADALADRQVA